MRASRIPAPAVAPAVALLAGRVPKTCPDDGCRPKRIAVVTGSDDRRPIVEVTFACGRVVGFPGPAP